MIKTICVLFILAVVVFLGSCGGAHSIGAGSGMGGAQLSSQPFMAGIAHVAGNYGFTQENFLLEGAERISQLGSSSIFVYLTPSFRTDYPDRKAGMWPAGNPATLTELAKTAPYQKVFALPFKTIVLTAYTFANQDAIAGFADATDRAKGEEQEFYDLAKYLYQHYAGPGKTFVLKNWEGDWIGLQGYDTSANVSDTMVTSMISWLSARERGVTRARQDSSTSGVSVFNAVEVNRVLDTQHGLTRVINAVVPKVHPDMVTYSSYDSTAGQNQDATSLTNSLNQALHIIKQFAPDPLGLGDHRILISEYGLFENTYGNEAVWRTQTILSTAKAAGLAGAFLWNVFDNECKLANGQAAPVGVTPGAPSRPTDGQCRGLWVVRPDGSQSLVLGALQKYW